MKQTQSWGQINDNKVLNRYNLHMTHHAILRSSPSLELLILSSQKEVNIDAIQSSVSNFTQEDFKQLHTLSHQHGLYPLLYAGLKVANALPVSEELLNNFKKSSLRITQQNMLMSAELLNIMKLFQQSSVDAMAFKGPVLGQFAYESVTMRQYGDLDILIKKSDIQKSVALLVDQGYQPEIELNESTIDTFYTCVNVIGLQKGSIRVEIHWELLSTNYAIDWDEHTLWSQSENITINRQSIKALSFENHILYLCAHGSKHLFERLEWICDIDRAIRSQERVDWQHLLVEAQKLGVERMLFLGLALAKLFFDLPLPQEIIEKSEADPQIKPLVQKVLSIHYSKQKQSKSYSTFWLLWQMREKFTDRLRFAYRGLFAPKFDDFKFIQLPKQLTFLYPLIRPYRLITKYFYK